MRAHIFIVFCLLFQSCFSQENVIKNNNNSQQNTSIPEEPQMDSTNVKFELDKSPKTKKKSAAQKEDLNTLKDTYSTNQESTFYSVKSSASSQNTQRSPSINQQTQMDNLVNYYFTNAPTSFEYNYFKYLAGNYNVDLINYLLEAKRLKPNNNDVYVQLAAYYFIKKDAKNLSESLDFLVKNKKIEQEVLLYAEHLLGSVDQNGTLITHGFDDTYSVLYLQSVKKIRPDVKIISLDFLQSSFYKSELKKEKFNLSDSTTIDVNYFAHLCQNNTSKNLFVSMTLPKPYLQKIVENSQISGISFAYQHDSEKLKTSNLNFYESFISKDQISKIETDKCKKLSSNYLPVLYSLKKELSEQKKTKEAKEIQDKIDKITTQAKVHQKLNSYR